jgi:CheY-like chemotaxis protein
LIVDDNVTSRLILTHHLEGWGIDVYAASCASQALSWIQKGERYDFAILDLYMPEVDGFTLARELRKHPHGEKLPLIVLSSIGDKTVHGEAETLKCIALLAKPIKQAQLSNVLTELFVLRTSAAQPASQLSSFDHTLAERMPLRILLAEDNLVNQKVAQHMLARLGYVVNTVGNGAEAVQELRHQTYDVILMDVQMPEVDGLEATRQIVAQWLPHERPYIIAMTAHALTGDEGKCIEAGMDAYVSKPIQLDRLVAALRQSKRAPIVADTVADTA